jgi:dTDP-glucose 4,6-dehydratase
MNSSKARHELGWTPRETLATGLAKTIDWYLANRPWCDAITQGTYRRERLGLKR